MPHGPLVYLPDVHILHTHDNIVVWVEEGTVESHNVVRVTIVHDLKLAHDSSPHFLLCLDMNDLLQSQQLAF